MYKYTYKVTVTYFGNKVTTISAKNILTYYIFSADDDNFVSEIRNRCFISVFLLCWVLFIIVTL